MKSRRHWLDGIAEIADADTGDLRKLAQVAGEDPATLFIGTVMDGADLRGQDLRGMLFTHLSVTKVKRDANTVVDPNPFVQEDLLPVQVLSALIYVARDDLFDLGDRRTIFRDFEVFKRGEELQFADACRKFSGAKIVIIDVYDVNQTIGFAPEIPGMIIFAVVDESETDYLGSLVSDDLVGILVIPRRVRQRVGSIRSQISQLTNELLIAAHNWKFIYALATQWRGAAFFCAKSQNGDAEVGAWGQLYSRIAQVRGHPVAGVRLVNHYGRRPWSEALGNSLFRELTQESANVPANVAAVILRSLHGAAGPNFGEEYERTVQTLMVALGWRVESIADEKRSDLAITDGRSQFKLAITGTPRMTARPVPRDFRLPDFIDEASLIIGASEFFDVDELILDLCDGKLWVSCQDLVRFRHGSNVWALFASHLGRVALWGSSWARAAFVTVLVRDALHRQQSIFPLPQPMQDAFFDASFAPERTISCSNIRFRNNNVIARVKVSSSDRSGKDNLVFDLAVGFGGPFITRIDLSG
ncbi:hypothetical protein [Bosea sp. ASV33]|uniref:hypothetical protein n=1 Tax=Bosea sp. ASV33 TaxID=2795106 RepID=UPI0018EACC74|nr:hypothetical protein [Bosea sp. ASV33]